MSSSSISPSTKAAGVALDIYETCPIIGSDSRVIGGSDWNAAAGSDIVVITSGKPRKPGMSRDDLVRDNFEIMKSIAPNLVQYLPERDRHAGGQPAGRDVAGALSSDQVPARAHHRDGRRARLGPDEHVRGDGA